jgi:hypothetical protein
MALNWRGVVMGKVFGLDHIQFILLLGLTMMVSLCFALMSDLQSIWLGFGIGFSFFVLIHMLIVGDKYPAFPSIIALIVCIQWVVASYAAYVSPPPSMELYIVNLDPATYFAYAVPAMMAMWIGLHTAVGSVELPHKQDFFKRKMSREESRFMDTLIIAGFAFHYFGHFLSGGLAFFWHILANLRFVGALSFFFTRTPGFKKRVGIVYALLFLDVVSGGGIFYEYMLWMTYLIIGIAFVYRWKLKLLIALACGIIILTAINTVKKDYRLMIREHPEMGYSAKVDLFFDMMLDYVGGKEREAARHFHHNLGDKLVRYNQGWAIARVMEWIPDNEPYAKGETIWASLPRAVLPSVILSDKKTLKEKVNEDFTRFTGVELRRGTNMGLGVAGEMYANFGSWRGVFGVFVYAYIIGFMIKKFLLAARKNILWFSWIPFVLLSTVIAEWNIMEVANGVFKSLIVMIALTYGLPRFRKVFLRR